MESTKQFTIPKNLLPQIQEALDMVEKELGQMPHQILEIPGKPNDLLIKYSGTAAQTKLFSVIKAKFGIAPRSMGFL